MRTACFTTLIAGSLLGQAQVYEFNPFREIPDDDPSGLVEVGVLPSAGAPIQSLAVTLRLTPVGDGGFVGDLYATLVHEGGGYAVLLNRPGRRQGHVFGYGDGVALSVTLWDGAPEDIHAYRRSAPGDEELPLGVDLTGEWQPDGRTADPSEVLFSSAREAFLESFRGADTEGRWLLFMADLSPGGSYRLDSWALSVTPIPEPAPCLATLGLSALGWAWFQRRRGKHRASRLPSD